MGKKIINPLLEVKNKGMNIINPYRFQAYELPLLLDYDSTSGAVIDLTGKNTLSPVGLSFVDIGGGKKSASFAGNSSSKITAPSTPFYKDNLMISVWQNWQYHSPVYNEQLVSFNYGTSNAVFGINISYGTLQIYYMYNHTTHAITGYNLAYGFAWNTWVNVCAFVSKGNFIKFYVNGILIGTSTSLYDPDYSSTTELDIGYAKYGSTYKGYIPKVQIFDGVPSNQAAFALSLFNEQKAIYGR